MSISLMNQQRRYIILLRNDKTEDAGRAGHYVARVHTIRE